MFERWYSAYFQEKLARPFVHLVFGARQTGKSTFLRSVLPRDAVIVDLSDPGERSRLGARPDEFLGICRALPSKKPPVVFVDEVQTVPAIFDAVQHLYDEDKKRWRFVLCGSSARKLRRTGANLLPGRSFLHRLYPLVAAEHPASTAAAAKAEPLLKLRWKHPVERSRLFPAWEIEPRLAYGSLPGIVAADENDRPDLLRAYSVVHLEEEIRREALIRDWGAFVRFLQFAAVESGKILNYAVVSRETGVSLPTVKSYYELLEDMFVGFRVPAYVKSERKSILSTPKFFLFDLGVRHAAAGLNPSLDVVRANPGPLFEQWVGVELWKRLQYLGQGKLYYQRTKDGAEVDFIVEREGRLTPIEVKWTEHPTSGDARHLLRFIKEHDRQTERGYVVCRAKRPMEIHERVLALPWFCL